MKTIIHANQHNIKANAKVWIETNQPVEILD